MTCALRRASMLLVVLAATPDLHDALEFGLGSARSRSGVVLRGLRVH